MEIRIFEGAGTDVAGRSVLRPSSQSGRAGEFSDMMSEAVKETRGADRKELARAEGAKQKKDSQESKEKGGLEATESAKPKEVEHTARREKTGKNTGADKAEKPVKAEKHGKDAENKRAVADNAHGQEGDKEDAQAVAAPVVPVEPEQTKTIKYMTEMSEGVATAKVLDAEGLENAGGSETKAETDKGAVEEGFEGELKEADGAKVSKEVAGKTLKHVETAPVKALEIEMPEVEEKAVDKGIEVKESAEHGKRAQGLEAKAGALSPSPAVKAEVSAQSANAVAAVPVEDTESPMNGGFDSSEQKEAGKEGLQDTKTSGAGGVTSLKKDGFSIEHASPAKPLAAGEKAEVYEKLSAGVRMSVAKGGGEVRLNLRPEHLGNLNIRLNIADSIVKVHILVENTSVKHMLESDNGALKEILGKQGLVLDTYSVEASPKAFSSGERGFSGFADTNLSGFNGNGQEGFSGRTGHEAGRNALIMEDGNKIAGVEVPVDTAMPRRHKENIDVFI